jgi:hypothetical protein
MVPDNVGKGLHEEEVCIDKECSGLWAEDGEPNED